MPSDFDSLCYGCPCPQEAHHRDGAFYIRLATSFVLVRWGGRTVQRPTRWLLCRPVSFDSSLVPWLRKVMFVVEQKTFLVKVGQRRTFVSDMYRVSNYISIERSTVELNRNLKGNLLLNGSFAIFFRQYLQMINSPWFERL